MIKPHVFSAVMDFFSTGLPVLTDEQPSPDTCELFYNKKEINLKTYSAVPL